MRKRLYLLSIILLCFLILSFYSNKQQDFRRTGSYFEWVKIIDFSPTPRINIEIEGKEIPVEIDLGCNIDFNIPKDILQNIKQKTFLRTENTYGIRGKEYLGELYVLPKLRIGRIFLQYPKIKGINPEFTKDSSIPKKTQNEFRNLARIGWTCFQRYNVFFDWRKQIIAFCDSLETLRKEGYKEDFVEVPFSILNGMCIAFEAETDKGPLCCVLDTGSTLSLIHSSNIESLDDIDLENVYTTSSFKMEGKDFGEVTFVQGPIKLPMKIDAILGMDFIYLKNIFIDFKNQKLYFSAPKEIKH